ncbi:MAG: aminodeoxychorismate/anthranilate synthase component II [Saprospiraceae bacterium]|nr:aminodeoxychorismate/anthranilate synthase component II [Bacteroidia bacterium]NNE16478.1 aminodeoxychorismate/anthranilate synthase component II [Saprospiraceae bacterium]NNL93470.1 aminodeoxychorismate/anthranilate synthase component II [Saprospiraceae bacterium]
MEKKVLVIDNYDSFTYNLVHSIEKILKSEVSVYRNDEISLEAVDEFDYIFISPGPGIPSEAGLTVDIIKSYYKTKKIFGVCLGLQSLVEALGGNIENLEQVFHGIESEMYQTENKSIIFQGIDDTFKAGRYHSWVAKKEDIPKELVITSVDNSGEVMSVEHINLPVYAVQFHPESIMTPDGDKMIENFLSLS